MKSSTVAILALIGIGAVLLKQSKRPSIDGLPVWVSGNQPHEGKEPAYC